MLGPVLFITYIDDLEAHMKGVSLYLYLDDTIYFAKVPTVAIKGKEIYKY